MGAQVLEGAAPGALLLLNTHAGLESYAGRFERYRFGVIDATAIAREQGIGSSSVVIINTTILGAYARLLGLPLSVLEKAYVSLGLGGDLPAAQHAYEQVRVCEAGCKDAATRSCPRRAIARRGRGACSATARIFPRVSRPDRGATRCRSTASIRRPAISPVRPETTWSDSSRP